MPTKPKVLIFAPGSKDGSGGSGLRALLENNKAGVLDAEIVGVVSYYQGGNNEQYAKEFNVPFLYIPEAMTADRFKQLIDETKGEWVLLSGWNKLLEGFDPRRTINIHPAPIPEFGGKGMYGINTHKAVLEAYKQGKLQETEIVMHFVTQEYDGGPIFFRYKIPLTDDDTPETLRERVKQIEHQYQSKISNLVIHGNISWDGEDKSSLKLPEGYEFL